MASKNDITGDKIQTKVGNNDKFKEGFEGIDWSVKLEVTKPTPDKPVEPTEEWDEKRIDIIGSNGNIGYEEEK
jgi:hypothetical protein